MTKIIITAVCFAAAFVLLMFLFIKKPHIIKSKNRYIRAVMFFSILFVPGVLAASVAAKTITSVYNRFFDNGTDIVEEYSEDDAEEYESCSGKKSESLVFIIAEKSVDPVKISFYNTWRFGMTDKIEKPFVLAVAGPTASGKTSLGVELAKRYDGEIISADSIQIYKGMDIASAKPSKDEMQGIPHHLIDILDRETSFSAADYVKLANEKIREILGRGKLPIIVGGTGLYIDSLLNNVRFSEGGSDEAYRAELYGFAAENGNEALHARLAEIDAEAARNIHPNNLVRVIRALEVYHVTGRTFSELKAESRLEESPYDSLIIGLDYTDRQFLYERINLRVDNMVSRGLIEEARTLRQEYAGMKTAANAIGIKELMPYFENMMPLQDCIEKIKQETRRYAKRQLTWFRKNERIKWIFLGEFDKKTEILEKSEKCIEKYRNV